MLTLSPRYSLFEEDLLSVSSQGATALQALSGAELFFTGCTGMLGKWLTDCLLWANERRRLALRITLLTRDAARLLAEMPHWAGRPDLVILEKDILKITARDMPACTHAVHGLNLPNDGLLSWPARHMRTALEGTRLFFELAGAAGCRRILLMSSGAVYNSFFPVQQPPYIEADELNTDSEAQIYGRTKQFLELYSAALGQSLDICVPIARCFSFCGAHIPLHSGNALGSFIKMAMNNEDIRIDSDGTPVRSFMYGSDMAVWLLSLLCQGKHGRPYNVASRHGVSLKELAETLLELSGGKGQVKIGGEAVRGNAPHIYLPDTSRAEGELSLCAETNFAEGIRRTIEWCRATKNSA